MPSFARGKSFHAVLNVLASVVDQATTAATHFMASVVVGRYGGADALGLFAIASTFVWLARGMHSAVLLEPISVLGPRRDDGHKYAYLRSTLIGSLLLTGAGTSIGAAVVVATDIIHSINGPLLHAFYAAFLYINFYCLQMVIRIVFYLEKKPLWAATQSIAYFFITAIGFFLAVATSKVSAESTYIILSASSIAICACQGRRLWQKTEVVSIHMLTRYFREHWQYGRWLLPAIPLGLAHAQGYYLFVGVFISDEGAGFLKAAETLIGPFSQIAIAMHLLLLPQASRIIDTKTSKEQKRDALKLSVLLLCAAGVYTVLVLVTAKDVLPLLFGEELAKQALPICYVLAFLPVSIAASLPASITVSALKRPKLRFCSLAIGTSATVLIGVPMMMGFQVYGAAIAMVVAQSLSTASLWVFLWWIWHQSLRASRPNKT